MLRMATINKGYRWPDTESQAVSIKTTDENKTCDDEDKVFMFIRLYLMNEPNYWVWQCNERQYSQNPAWSVTTETKEWVSLLWPPLHRPAIVEFRTPFTV